MAQPWADARCRWTLREFPAVYWHQSCLTENLRSASAGMVATRKATIGARIQAV